MIRQDSIINPPLNPNNPEGLFTAHVVSLMNDDEVPFSLNNHDAVCSYLVIHDSICNISGNWFE